MITSIVLKDRYNIGVDNNERFQLGDNKVKLDEVPFVRYRFENFTEKDKDYITGMMNKFKYSAHLAEVTIKEGFEEQVRFLNDAFENLIVFLYVPITDEMVTNNSLGEREIGLLGRLDSMMVYERIMLKDNSNSLYLVSANKLKKQVESLTGFSAREIGICSSPLSFGEDACLTAVRARALESMYVENDKCAIPSANHECMNCCGCIRYNIIEHDLEAPIGKKNAGGSAKSKKESTASNGDAKHKKRSSKKVMSAWK